MPTVAEALSRCLRTAGVTRVFGRAIPGTPNVALRDDALITATRMLNESLSDLSRAIGDDGKLTIPESDRQNLAKFLTISRARLDNLVARLKQSGR